MCSIWILWRHRCCDARSFRSPLLRCCLASRRRANLKGTKFTAGQNLTLDSAAHIGLLSICCAHCGCSLIADLFRPAWLHLDCCARNCYIWVARLFRLLLLELHSFCCTSGCCILVAALSSSIPVACAVAAPSLTVCRSQLACTRIRLVALQNAAYGLRNCFFRICFRRNRFVALVAVAS